jgi:hypothetical protein
LLGLSREEVKGLIAAGVDWEAVVEQVGEQAAWWAERTVARAIHMFRFDWRALKEELVRPVRHPEFLAPLPGARFVPLNTLPPEKAEDILLTLIADGGPSAYLALLAYLRLPDLPTRS